MSSDSDWAELSARQWAEEVLSLLCKGVRGWNHAENEQRLSFFQPPHILLGLHFTATASRCNAHCSETGVCTQLVLLRIHNVACWTVFSLVSQAWVEWNLLIGKLRDSRMVISWRNQNKKVGNNSSFIRNILDKYVPTHHYIRETIKRSECQCSFNANRIYYVMWECARLGAAEWVIQMVI